MHGSARLRSLLTCALPVRETWIYLNFFSSSVVTWTHPLTSDPLKNTPDGGGSTRTRNMTTACDGPAGAVEKSARGQLLLLTPRSLRRCSAKLAEPPVVIAE